MSDPVDKLTTAINQLRSDLLGREMDALKAKSMLEQARIRHDGLRKVKPDDQPNDKANPWLRPYARTQTRATVEKNSVWFTAYMPSIIAARRESSGLGREHPLETLAHLALWNEFRKLHIDAIHTGPVMTSGGYATVAEADRSTSLADDEPARYPTMDGWFDPIKLEIDTQLGTEEHYRNLVNAAKDTSGAIVIGDIVPGHTGLGPDFHLALKGVSPYTGLYMLIRVDHILEDEKDTQFNIPAETRRMLLALSDFSRLLTPEEVEILKINKIIPGKLEREMGVQAGSGWSITGPIEGFDAEENRINRRWLYLHFFHPKQPTLNWVDPSYSAWRLVNGQLTYIIAGLSSEGVRLDANAFLGVEAAREGTQEASRVGEASRVREKKDTWSEAHPLSEMATQMLAWQARRLGGFSFQENNMPLSSIAASAKYGPDLSYDFITRPACQHALLTGNTNLLHFMYSEMQRAKIDPMSLIHALQNHDEFTYELVHLSSLENEFTTEEHDVHLAPFFERCNHAERPCPIFRSQDKKDQRWDETERRLLLTTDKPGEADRTAPSSVWADIKTEMRAKAIVGKSYNRESGNGLCTTMVGLVAASLGISSLDGIKSRKNEIQAGHLLLAGFNALQPGVFALSGWDLVGALPLDLELVPKEALNTGKSDATAWEMDYRWINRGAYKLLDTFSGESLRFIGSGKEKQALPAATALYGPIDLQLTDPTSFASQLAALLGIRKKLKIASSKFWGTVDIDPEPAEGSKFKRRTLFCMMMGLDMQGSSTQQEAKPIAALAVFNFSQDIISLPDKLLAITEGKSLPWLAKWMDITLQKGEWTEVYSSISGEVEPNGAPGSFELKQWEFKIFTMKTAINPVAETLS